MWKPFHMDLKPQPLHKGFIQIQAVTQDISQLSLSKSGLATQDRFPKLGQWELWFHCKHTFILKCTSTAYEYCETPCTCLTLILEPSQMGQKSQSSDFTVVYHLSGTPFCTPNDGKNSKTWIETWYAYFHMHIHCM